MLAAMVVTVWVLVLRHPVGLLVAPEAAAWAAMVAMVAQQIEQEKQQNLPQESKLPEMPQKPPTPEWQRNRLPATKRPATKQLES
jgi:hypothetical protein